ncbi:MAG TPA: hypothetical protein VNO17_05300 [Actinomycetota bacterium]|nr:hypothetical protein [Actinomycetota bacterium]
MIAVHDATTWVVLRAAGIGSYLMLFLAVAGGLVATAAPFGRRVSNASATIFHRTASTAGLLLLAVHLGGLLVDRYVRLDLLDLVVPLRAGYRPIALALGIAAMDAAVVVVAPRTSVGGSARRGGGGRTCSRSRRSRPRSSTGCSPGPTRSARRCGGPTWSPAPSWCSYSSSAG